MRIDEYIDDDELDDDDDDAAGSLDIPAMDLKDMPSQYKTKKGSRAQSGLARIQLEILAEERALRRALDDNL